MCFIKKKSETPLKRREKENKRIKKLMKKRDKLDRDGRWQPGYEEKRKGINRSLAEAISSRDLAEYEIKHPPKPPKYQDNSRTTNVEISPTVTVNKQTQKGIQVNDSFKNIGNGNKGSKKRTATNPDTPTKKPKAKTIFIIVLFVLILAGAIAATVKITSCVNAKKSAYSNACAIFATTSE